MGARGKWGPGLGRHRRKGGARRQRAALKNEDGARDVRVEHPGANTVDFADLRPASWGSRMLHAINTRGWSLGGDMQLGMWLSVAYARRLRAGRRRSGSRGVSCLLFLPCQVRSVASGCMGLGYPLRL